MSVVVGHRAALDIPVAAAVRTLAGAVTAADGREPLSDQALSLLAAGPGAADHLLAHDGDRLVGYAQAAASPDATAGWVAEVAAEAAAVPGLLAALRELAGRHGAPSLRVWSHGSGSPLGAALAADGFTAERRLHQLRRPLVAAGRQAVTVPAGVSIDAFAVGRDEAAWLAVNAAAFAHHPEQGGWTERDLVAREREPWFDPAGFLLARREDRLIGFHWTKQHGSGLGEVYVIGVHPSEQGSGLGAVLLQLGLDWLAEHGCDTVMLYVDESNTAAMRLYERTGFTRHDLDVQWRADLAPTS